MKIKHFFAIVIALFPFMINAQNYDNLWAEFNKNIENRLPESAVKVLDNIEKQAVKDKNDVQLLKVVINHCEVISMTSESPYDSIINYCKSKLQTLSAPSQVILQVEIAKANKTHFRDNSEESIESQFIIAIEKAKELGNYSMRSYTVLYDKEKINYDLDLEPTLYDFAMHNMLDHLDISSFARVYIDGYSVSDDVFNKYNEYYQQLIDFDLAYNYVKAANFNRIHQLEDLAIYFNDSKHNLQYFNELDSLVSKCDDKITIGRIKASQADLMIKEENYVEALRLCNEVIAMNLKSGSSTKCKDCKKEILKKHVAVEMQNEQIPGEPIPARLSYKNVTNPTYRIYKVNSVDIRKNDGEVNSILLFDKVIAKKTLQIPEETDYKEHSSLIAFPSLEVGTYMLVFSPNDRYDNLEDLHINVFQVSNLTYIINSFKDKTEVYTLDRKTGKPVGGVTVNITKDVYNYNKRRYILKSIEKVVSDENGCAILPQSVERGSINLCYGKDTLFRNKNDYFDLGGFSSDKDKFTIKTRLYTDRPIYRPGQMVQYKGVVYRSNGKEYYLNCNDSIIVNLKDSNNQIIETQSFVTDEYGAFSGSFVLPEDRLNGNFSISTGNGSIRFKVEEYKRPTFEVTFNAPDKEYAIDDYVNLSGDVKSFAGFGLANVNYEYTIMRQTSFPCRLWWFVPNYIADKQINSGNGVTDDNGSFNIDFQLLPDNSVKVNEFPMYTYIVNVKATNVQGETREAKYYLNASYNKFNFSLDIENQFVSQDVESLTLDNLKNCKINVSNIAGEKTSTNIECKIYKLPENKKIRKHLGDFDRQILSDDELETLFPNFDYYNKKSENLNDYDVVYHNIIEDSEEPSLTDKNIDLSSGRYIIELKSLDDTLSQFTEEFILFNPKSNKMPCKNLGWSAIDKATAQPGDIVNFSFGSSEKDVMAFLVVDNCEKVFLSERILLNNNIKTVSFKVKDEDRGRLHFNIVFEKFNEFYNIQYVVDVPYENLKLDIKLDTERDILMPGVEETWNVKIHNNDKIGTTSSLLAGMYDASLNSVSQFFTKVNWDLNVTPLNLYGTRMMVDDNHTNYINGYYNNMVYRFHFNYGDLFSNSSLLKFNRYYNGRKVMSINIVEDEAFCCAEEELVDVEIYKLANPVNLDENEDGNPTQESPAIQIRSNFNETAFFYPNLKTDENGNATFSFTMPDALTRWKLRMLAYSKDLKVGTLEKTFVTQKPVIIMADMPRFCYDEDTLWLVANVVNLSEEAISPVAKLEIRDEGLEMREEMILSEKEIKMEEIPAGRSQSVRWKVAMKKDVNLLTFRFSATTENFCDAEQHTMPVLSTEVFMTQTFSLIAKGNEKKTYYLNFKEKDERNHAITLNFSKNPTWYAVQALPYLDKDNEKYAESAFYRYFTNSVAKHSASSLKDSPEMAKLLESFENDSTSTMSELEKNQELKEILLNETPWVLDAKNESEQRANITKLFDTKALDKNINSALKIIEKKQKPSGGWPWVEGMPESAYVTQYILGGLGRLRSLTNGDEQVTSSDLENIIAKKAFHFIENDVVKRFSDLKEADKKNYRCSVMIVRELFVMSYFPGFGTSAKFNEAKAFFVEKLKKDWTNFNFEAQAGIALIFNRNGNKNEAMAILKSLRECAQKNELGMYWFEGKSIGVEDEARILEAFNEIDPKNEEIDAMRFWILGEKRTNMWYNDRATAEAIYAIVNRGTDWLNDNGEVVLTVNDDTIADLDGINMINKIICDNTHSRSANACVCENECANVSIDNQTNHQVWGGMFRQYFVPIDKVKKSNEDMKIRRELFVERIEDNKTKYLPISEEEIKVGDKIKIVLYIENQQNMEFVYLKDLRGACFEPTGQISRYHYSDGLWYYQSTSDVAMEFFFDNMPKGKHELSHTVYVTKEGSFSAGYAVIQCQYAPEFGAYSDGSRISVSGE